MAEERTVLLRVELDTAQLKKAGDEAAAKLDQLKVKQALMRGESKQGTLEYAKLSAEIRKTTKEVKDNATALNIHERLSKKNTGSMNELKEQMLAAKIALGQMSAEMKNGEAGKALTKQIDDINESLKESEEAYGQFGRSVGNYAKMTKEATKDTGDLGLVFEDVYGELKPMTGRIGELEDRMYELALAGQADTEEFKKLQVETVALKKTILDVDKATDALAENTGISGFAGLIGETGERLLALDFKGATQRISALKAMSQATDFKTMISGAKNLGSGLLQLGKVILANPLFMLAGLIGGIVIAAKMWIDQTEQETIRTQERYTASLERTTQAYKDQADAIRDSGDRQVRLALSQNKSLEEVQRLRLAAFDKAHAKELDQLNALNNEKLNAEKLLEEARIKMLHASTFGKAEALENAKTARENFNAKAKEYRELKKQLDTYSTERLIIVNETNEQIQDREKATADRLKAQAEQNYRDRLDVERRISDLILQGRDLTNANEVAKIDAHYKYLSDTSTEGAEELLRIEAERNQALEELNNSARQLEIDQVNENYKRQIQDAKGNSAVIVELRKNQVEELESIDIKYQNERIARDVDYENRRKAIEKQRVEEARKTSNELLIIEAEMNLELSRGTAFEFVAWKQLQDARIKVIQDNAKKELENTQLTADERKKIEKEAELEISRIKKESIGEVAEVDKKTNEQRKQEQKQLAISFIGIANQLADAYSQIQQNQIQTEINEEQDKYDEKSKLLQAQLDQGIISQVQFNAQKSALDSEFAKKESDLKREAFQKNKQAQIINAIMGTAQGIVQGLAAPPPLGLIMAGLAGALGGAQVALIQSQPTPKFAKGGIAKEGVFGGKSHSNGGTKGFFDDGTQIEVEKDEAFFVLNKRSSKIAGLSRLNQAGGGVPLMENGGSLTFASGGAFSGSAGRSVSDQNFMRNLIVSAVMAIPNPVVDVKDINEAQSSKAFVEDSASFG